MRLYGTRLSDVLTAYKAVRRDVAVAIRLECRGFEIETEIAAKLARRGYRIVEIPNLLPPAYGPGRQEDPLASRHTALGDRYGREIRRGEDGLVLASRGETGHAHDVRLSAGLHLHIATSAGAARRITNGMSIARWRNSVP